MKWIKQLSTMVGRGRNFKRLITVYIFENYTKAISDDDVSHSWTLLLPVELYVLWKIVGNVLLNTEATRDRHAAIHGNWGEGTSVSLIDQPNTLTWKSIYYVFSYFCCGVLVCPWVGHTVQLLNSVWIAAMFFMILFQIKLNAIDQRRGIETWASTQLQWQYVFSFIYVVFAGYMYLMSTYLYLHFAKQVRLKLYQIEACIIYLISF